MNWEKQITYEMLQTALLNMKKHEKDERAIEIVSLYLGGWKQKEIAQRLNVSITVISQVINKKARRYMLGEEEIEFREKLGVAIWNKLPFKTENELIANVLSIDPTKRGMVLNNGNTIPMHDTVLVKLGELYLDLYGKHLCRKCSAEMTGLSFKRRFCNECTPNKTNL